MRKVVEESFIAISGSQRPYIFDLPQVLSLPEGFEFRFRYRHKWIERELWDRIAANPSSFVGKQLLLLFHSQELKRVIPLRRATFSGVEEFGPVIYLRFRLGTFTKSDLDVRAIEPTDLDNQIREWQDAVSNLTHVAGVPDDQQPFRLLDLSQPLPDGWHLRRVQGPLPLTWEENASNGWGVLARVLQEEPKLLGVPLFYVLGFEGEGRKLLTTSAVRNGFFARLPWIAKAKIIGFRLVEGGRYRLRILTWSGTYPRAAEMRVSCDSDDGVLALEGAADLVLGRYDVLEYTYLGVKPGYTEVAIGAEPVTKDAGKPASASTSMDASPIAPSEWTTWPAIYLARIPVAVRSSFPRLLAILALGAGGAALYLLSPRLFPAPPGQPITIVASGLQAIGLFLSFLAASGITEKLIKVREHVQKAAEKPPSSSA